MGLFGVILIVVSGIWVAGEIVLGLSTLARRSGRASADRGTLILLWITIVVALNVAAFLTFSGRGWGHFSAAAPFWASSSRESGRMGIS